MKKHRKLFLAFFCMVLILAAGFSAFAADSPLTDPKGNFRENQASTEVLLQKESGSPPPRITQIIRDQAVRPNTEFTLDADVEGEPFTKIEWSISRDGGVTYSNVSSGSVLFKTSQGFNSPENLPYRYKLRIENGGGSDEAVVQVLVTSNPDEYSVDSITDSETGITVTGPFHKSTKKLVVIPKSADEYPDLAGRVEADCVPFRAYEVHLVNEAGEKLPYIGMLELDFPVGTIFEGSRLRVFHQRPDNRIETLSGAVSGNRLKVSTDSLSPFLVETPRSKTHIITAKAGPNGSVEPGGTVYVARGESQPFVFTGETGYVPYKLELDGKETDFTGNTFLLAKVNRDHLLEITFKKPPSPGGGGSGGNGNGGGGSWGGPGSGNTGGSGSGNGPASGHTGGDAGTPEAGAPETGAPDTGTQNEVYYKITAKSQGNGRVSPSKTVAVRHGGSKTFYFYPDKGYEVDQVWVDGTPVTVFWNSYTFTAATKDAVLEVSFKLRTAPPSSSTQTVTALAGPGGSISPEGVTTVRRGGDLYVHFEPDRGYRVASVVIDGKPSEMKEGSWHFINITSDRVIEVSFEKGGTPEPEKKFKVRASVKGQGGSVSPDGEIWVREGGSQTLYFYPQEGYELESVTVNGKKAEVYEGSCTLEDIAENLDLVVSFKPAGRQGLSCGCKACSLWSLGRCICPWCWLLPLLVLMGLLAVIWRVFYILKRKWKAEAEPDEAEPDEEEPDEKETEM